MERIRIKRRNPIAQDLRTSKYRMRVVTSKKLYNRAKQKQNSFKEIND